MSNVRKNFIISGLLVMLSLIYTVLVKMVDVAAIGPNKSEVGFSSLNSFVHNLTGESELWYNITEYLALIPIFMVFVYALIGLKQLIERKSLFKVDRELLALGIFYIVVIAVYLFFELFIVNYRPVLMDGELEASYPSSHTLIALCLCMGSVLINKVKYNRYPITRIINLVLFITMVVLVVGRILSGVHWFSDIIGGVVISSAIVMMYYSYLKYLQETSK
ncbi:MAG: phosphatase PAP2 family protein [Bacilli bacterium]|nr:phosphatase PAP2 family protein [Bacilli bacterium]